MRALVTPLVLLSSLPFRIDDDARGDRGQRKRTARYPVQSEIVGVVEGDHCSILDKGRPGIQDNVSLHHKVLHLAGIDMRRIQNWIYHVVLDVGLQSESVSTSRTIASSFRLRCLQSGGSCR